MGAQPRPGSGRSRRPAVEHVQVRARRAGQSRRAGRRWRVPVRGHAGPLYRPVRADSAHVLGPAGGRGHHRPVRPGRRRGPDQASRPAPAGLEPEPELGPRPCRQARCGPPPDRCARCPPVPVRTQMRSWPRCSGGCARRWVMTPPARWRTTRRRCCRWRSRPVTSAAGMSRQRPAGWPSPRPTHNKLRLLIAAPRPPVGGAGRRAGRSLAGTAAEGETVVPAFRTLVLEPDGPPALAAHLRSSMRGARAARGRPGCGGSARPARISGR